MLLIAVRLRQELNSVPWNGGQRRPPLAHSLGWGARPVHPHTRQGGGSST